MKINFNAILLFSLFFTLFQCEVPFDSNTRLLIKGELLDENNQPIENANIAAYVGRDNEFSGGQGFNGSGGQLLGESLSNGDGTFSIITLLGRSNNFTIEVFVNEAYTKYTYVTSTQMFTPTNLLIDLGKIPIHPISDVNFNITRNGPIGTELQYTIDYQNIFCREFFIEEDLDEEETFCNEIEMISGVLNDENPNALREFKSLVGSEIIFTYSINEQPEETQIVTIDQPNYEFNFSY